MVLFDMICPHCGQGHEIEGPLGKLPYALCLFCGHELVRHFEGMPPLNLGVRSEGHYRSRVDYDIARFQFEHLK